MSVFLHRPKIRRRTLYCDQNQYIEAFSNAAGDIIQISEKYFRTLFGQICMIYRRNFHKSEFNTQTSGLISPSVMRNNFSTKQFSATRFKIQNSANEHHLLISSLNAPSASRTRTRQNADEIEFQVHRSAP
jgi:hypothetical protein